MRLKKLPMPERLLIAGGLLLTTIPGIFAEYVKIPDFFHGLLLGMGLGLEIWGLILLKRYQYS